VKTTGDGLLVEFASVVYAVACAAAIQQEMGSRASYVEREPPLQLRIGVNLGDVISVGSDIFGDAVNLAARLESICEPGGLTVSRAVHEQVRGKLPFPFAYLGERRFKNISRSMQVFALAPQTIALIPETAFEEPSDPPPPLMALTAATRLNWESSGIVRIASAAFALLRRGRLLRAIAASFAAPPPFYPIAATFAPQQKTRPRPTIAGPSPELAQTLVGADAEWRPSTESIRISDFTARRSIYP
jgi:hypothetical protein